jgi:hypothetical protein
MDACPLYGLTSSTYCGFLVVSIFPTQITVMTVIMNLYTLVDNNNSENGLVCIEILSIQHTYVGLSSEKRHYFLLIVMTQGRWYK